MPWHLFSYDELKCINSSHEWNVQLKGAYCRRMSVRATTNKKRVFLIVLLSLCSVRNHALYTADQMIWCSKLQHNYGCVMAGVFSHNTHKKKTKSSVSQMKWHYNIVVESWWNKQNGRCSSLFFLGYGSGKMPLCHLFYPFDLEMSICTISLFLIMTINNNIVPMEHESHP